MGASKTLVYNYCDSEKSCWLLFCYTLPYVPIWG